MKKSTLLLLLICTACYSFAQTNWERTEGWDQRDRANCIVNTESASYIFGTSELSGGKQLALSFLKLRHDSTLVVLKRDTTRMLYPTAACLTPDHDLICVMTIYEDSVYTGMAVARFDTNGTRLWMKQVSSEIMWANYIKSLPDSSLLITGRVVGADTTIFTMKLTASGDSIWKKTYLNGSGRHYPSKTVHLNDGCFLISVFSALDTIRANRYIIINNDGNVLATDTLVNPTPVNQGMSLIKVEDGGYMATMADFGMTNLESFLIKYDSAFTLQWSVTRKDDYFVDAAALPSGKISILSPPTGLLVFSSTGAVIDSTLFTVYSDAFPNPIGISYLSNNTATIIGTEWEQTNWVEMYVANINAATPLADNFGCFPPEIQSATVSLVDSSTVQFLGDAVENIEHADILTYQWYFQNGDQQGGKSGLHSFNHLDYPDMFWCQMIVTDAVGCTDTITIDAYTGNVIFPNPIWDPSLQVHEKTFSTIGVSATPNPFYKEFTILIPENISPSSVIISDLAGARIHPPMVIEKNKIVVDGTNVKPGMYVVRLSGIASVKVVKY